MRGKKLVLGVYQARKDINSLTQPRPYLKMDTILQLAEPYSTAPTTPLKTQEQFVQLVIVVHQRCLTMLI